MADQLMSALFAVGSGALIAVLLFLPFVFLSYRQHGRLGPLRTLLPLPDPDDIRCASAQLTPFQFLEDIQNHGRGHRGAVLVSLLWRLRARLLPSPAVQDPDGVLPAPGPITAGRRLTGMFCDALAVFLLSAGAAIITNAWQMHLGRHGDALDNALTQQVAFWVPFALLGLITLATGRTVGDVAVFTLRSRAGLPGLATASAPRDDAPRPLLRQTR